MNGGLGKIRVLVVDDSAIVRRVLTRQLGRDPSIEVVGAAPDPYVAREMIVERSPHVLTLDVEMPRMDGLTFLGKLMRYKPLPVVIVSSLTPRGSELALEAMQRGATDVVCKPGAAYTVRDLADELVEKVKAAARTRVRKRSGQGQLAKVSLPCLPANQLLAIGASTGGTVAIEELLRAMPEQTPATVITQHMPPEFTAAFAKRLDGLCALEVREAKDGDPIYAGRVLVAPGGLHLLVRRHGNRYVAVVKDGPRVQRQKPAVDVLFKSVTRAAGEHAVGVLLTGMGTDGAEGLLAMRKTGAATAAQDEESCTVFGMPRAAIQLDAADAVVSLQDMPKWIASTFQERLEQSVGSVGRRIRDAEWVMS